MTIQEAQQQVHEWITTVGVKYFSELTNMAILTEEVGELARIMARIYGDQSFKKMDLESYIQDETGIDTNEIELYKKKGQMHPAIEKKLLEDEMSDIFWVLLCLANQTGIDLTEALQRNLEKKNIRDSERHKENKKLM